MITLRGIFRVSTSLFYRMIFFKKSVTFMQITL